MLDLIATVWKRMPKMARRWITRRVEATFTVSAAGIVLNEAGEVLLLNHLLRPASGWGLPGGFVNAGEQAEDALRREIREETGIDLRGVELVRIRTLGRHVEVIFRAVAVGEPRVQSREIIELGWFKIDEMPPEMALDQQFIVDRVVRSDEGQ
jgi:ADP-ribose pyrophosphatase YjhB (NUDIX family)